MRTILVCVRTQVAAQTVAAAAARLGVAHAVRTAVTMVEALARLSEQPADLVLADPSLSRPDSAEFSRRVLAVAPGATVVDTFPASLTCTWTCVGAGGGTCTAAGSGNLNDTVNLPKGGTNMKSNAATLRTDVATAGPRE